MKLEKPEKNLTKEHQYPRKKAAEELLNEKLSEIENNKDLLFQLYEGKYAKFNYVSSTENKYVSKHQKTENFIDPEQADKDANINLIGISNEQLQKVKKGDKNVINEILKNNR